jgi:hypothetical protein
VCGGFLEWCDERIGKSHLLKKSFLLIKAWCYYESRLLGAHHGMLSSYALEIMVLFVANGHGSELDTPLSVFHRFLEVFSEFDFDRYCLSILGPIPLDSFPHPRVDEMALPTCEPLIPPAELRDAVLKYSSGGEAASAIDLLSPGLSCVTYKEPLINLTRKHLNIMDPLMPTNNLGRSVSRTSYMRMRMAFAHGSKSLSHVFMHQESSIASQRIALYFNNTWNSIHRVSFDNRSFSTSTGRLSPEYLFMSTSTSQRLGRIPSVPEVEVKDDTLSPQDSGTTINPEGSARPRHRRANSVTSTISIGSSTTVLAMQMLNFNPNAQSSLAQGDTLVTDVSVLMNNIDFARQCQDSTYSAPEPEGLPREESTASALRTFDKNFDATITYASIAAHGLTPRDSRTLSRRDSLSVNASVSVSPTRSPVSSAKDKKTSIFHQREIEYTQKSDVIPSGGEGVDAHSLSRKLKTWSLIAQQPPKSKESNSSPGQSQ